jgi:serine O-acetyltransferase
MKNFKEDIKAFARQSGLREKLKLFITSPGLSAVFLIRLEQSLYRQRLLILSYLVYRINLSMHGIDVLPGAKIGKGLRIDHPFGIVIGAGVEIGENCTILHGVTIGEKFLGKAEKRFYPVIGNYVTIGCNASVLGNVSVGSKSFIAAHSLVLKSLEENSKFYEA